MPTTNPDAIDEEDTPGFVRPTVAGPPAVPGIPVPGAPGVVVPPGTQMFPENETRHKEGPDVTETVSRPKLAPEQLKALEGHKALADSEKAIADEQFKADQAKRDIETKGATEKVDEFARQEAERQKAMEQSQASIDEWADRLRTAGQRYDAAPLPSLFGDKTTGGKVLMGLGLALGALGSAAAAQANARLGGNGTAPDTVGEIIRADLDRQRQNIKELSDKVVMAKTGLADAREARRLMLADVDVRGAKAFQKIMAITEARLSAQGMTADEIKKHQSYVDADKGYQQAADDAASKLTETHTTAKQTEADTTTTRTGQGSGKDNLASLRRDRIAANIEEYNKAAAEVSKLGDDVITPEVLDTVQKNEAQIHAAESAHGALGAVGVTAGRAAGIIPKSKYDGLTDEQAKAMQAIDTMLQHGSEMQPSTGEEVSKQWKDVNRPKAGTSQELINERIQHLKQAGKDYKAIIDPTNIGGRADAVAPGAVPTEPTPAFLQKPPAAQKNSVTKLKAEDVPTADDANGPNASKPLEEDPTADELPAPTKALPSMKTLQGKPGRHAPIEAPLKAPDAGAPAGGSGAPSRPAAIQNFIDQWKAKHPGKPPEPIVLKNLKLTPKDFE